MEIYTPANGKNAKSFVAKKKPKNPNFRHLADVKTNGVVWSVFYAYAKDHGWHNYKFATTKKSQPRKSNYWLSTNGERMANNHDVPVAEKHQPWMIDMIFNGWLFQDDFYNK